ncbi:DNA mismatch repair endonuclease MutL [Clostridium sp. SHJSY1]|uniref:DNA mismatch repair endonuclease MutL n=1 Tax=Clostridium sp. SHJSY1 TaxID=2942483 RepID=UPI0028758FC7|nr:DNA mismatch repair endonuclease MutL [Clostridium sp. SHJSY1]MDS0524526.1 DNA mismatch repair endonuclease MutL [Clostridium sp. SHJSY1]
MKRINLLDENTSNKIAAGEVVERPSSVVKELIENSIDAGSKNITIEIEEGGAVLIRIIDDGDGIHPDDIKKAFLPHATSKIRNSDDIYTISTLGFRGEALPSIAAVGKVNIKSRIEDEDFGRELIVEGGEIKDFKECGINIGTTLEVRDLFYNVPARKKFLKSISREGSLITDIINRTSLANPSISFKLYNNGKKVLHTYGSGNLKDVLRTVYGKSITDNLLYFESSDDILTVYGYIGKEEIARGSRNNQSIFVNGRYIKHKTIVAAVENAFKSFSTVNKFPFFTLFIEVYPEFVDVNIHPTKAEIKFTDDRMIFKKVFDTVHETLKKDVFDTFKIPEEEARAEKSYTPKFEEIKLDIKPLTEEKVSFNSFETREKIHLDIPVDLKSPTIIEENVMIKEPTLPIHKVEPNTSQNPIKEECMNIMTKKEQEITPVKKEVKSNDNIQVEVQAKFPPLRIIGQFNKTYILAEYEEVLYMIDQHAAHEKILFEKYLKQIENGSLIVQPLLLPTIIDLTIDDYASYEENVDIFKNAGFTLEEFGGNSLTLKEVPYFLGKLNPKSLFLNILDNIKAMGSGKTTEVKYNKIATMACKAAVKGNDRLSEIEMIKLVEELRYIADPFHCPHGRPTIIKFSNYDLEKKFRRIV